MYASLEAHFETVEARKHVGHLELSITPWHFNRKSGAIIGRHGINFRYLCILDFTFNNCCTRELSFITVGLPEPNSI